MALAGELPEGWDADLPIFDADPKGTATRKASGAVLNALAAKIGGLVGGSADLAGSNNSQMKGLASFLPGADGIPRNMDWGIREHGMGAAMNGMALHGGVIPFGATFLVFSDYMRPSVRLAALMKLHTRYIYTHDSIGLGEDGPTHQPVEHLAALRAIPQLAVFRPGGCQRGSRVLEGRPALGRTGGAGPDAAERPGARSERGGERRKGGPRRVHLA